MYIAGLNCRTGYATARNMRIRDAGTGGAGGAAAPLAFCWEGQGGKKCPLSIKNIITVSFQGAFS